MLTREPISTFESHLTTSDQDDSVIPVPITGNSAFFYTATGLQPTQTRCPGNVLAGSVGEAWGVGKAVYEGSMLSRESFHGFFNSKTDLTAVLLWGFGRRLLRGVQPVRLAPQQHVLRLQ